jgi:hypothetical protein
MYIVGMILILKLSRIGVVMYSFRIVIHEVSKRNHHRFGETPTEASRHSHAVAVVEEGLSKLLSEDISVLGYYLSEYFECWLKLSFDFFEERHIEERFIQGHNLLVRPMHHSLCDCYAIEVWTEE